MRKSNLEKVRAVLENCGGRLEEKADGDVYVDGMADGVRFAMDTIDERDGEDVGILHRQSLQSKESS